MDSEQLAGLNRLKREIFHQLLEIAGRVFVVVRYSEDVVIGKRGFLPEEKEKGLVLVFNRRMNFIWDDHGIDARLVFGTRPEHCLIPSEHVVGLYSPELNTQFLSLPDAPRQGGLSPEKDGRVIRVDFQRRRD